LEQGVSIRKGETRALERGKVKDFFCRSQTGVRRRGRTSSEGTRTLPFRNGSVRVRYKKGGLGGFRRESQSKGKSARKGRPMFYIWVGKRPRGSGQEIRETAILTGNGKKRGGGGKI